MCVCVTVWLGGATEGEREGRSERETEGEREGRSERETERERDLGIITIAATQINEEAQQGRVLNVRVVPLFQGF